MIRCTACACVIRVNERLYCKCKLHTDVNRPIVGHVNRPDVWHVNRPDVGHVNRPDVVHRYAMVTACLGLR